AAGRGDHGVAPAAVGSRLSLEEPTNSGAGLASHTAVGDALRASALHASRGHEIPPENDLLILGEPRTHDCAEVLPIRRGIRAGARPTLLVLAGEPSGSGPPPHEGIRQPALGDLSIRRRRLALEPGTLPVPALPGRA